MGTEKHRRYSGISAFPRRGAARRLGRGRWWGICSGPTSSSRLIPECSPEGVNQTTVNDLGSAGLYDGFTGNIFARQAGCHGKHLPAQLLTAYAGGLRSEGQQQAGDWLRAVVRCSLRLPPGGRVDHSRDGRLHAGSPLAALPATTREGVRLWAVPGRPGLKPRCMTTAGADQAVERLS